MILLTAQTAHAYDFEVDGIWYNITNSDNNEVGVTKDDVLPYTKYTGNVTIPSTVTYKNKTYSVTSIQDEAFYTCSKLTSVTIPNSVKTIGNHAFRETGIKSINIPDGVTSIGDLGFYGCKSLASVTLPESVKDMGSSAFRYCTSLTTISIPNSLSLVSGLCFSGCTSLKSVTLPNSVKEICDNAFEDCTSLTYMQLPTSLEKIRRYAFSGCTKLWKIVVSSDLDDVVSTAFSGCDKLTNIEYSEGVETVTDVFSGMQSIRSVKLSSTVTTIESKAFKGCSKLSSFDIPNPNNITSIGYNAFTETDLFDDGSDVTTTQSTAAFNFRNRFGSATMAIKCGGKTYNIEAETYPTVITGLSCYTKYSFGCYLILSNGYEYKLFDDNFTTKKISFSISADVSSTSIENMTVAWDKGDAIEEIIETNVYGLDNSDSEVTALYGLDPQTSYKINYAVRIKGVGRETYSSNVATKALELTTLQPKVVSSTCAIAAATTNISDEETSVGFQWKKYDAPETLNPNEGYTAIYDGQLEGYIKNLQPTYYNVRAFYKSAAGTYYYSDWVTFDQTDFSYFEPTVHTYNATDITYNSAKLKGYVMQGTDDVTNQGFEYWKASSSAANAMVAYAPAATDNVTTVVATGQVMTVKLENLLPSTTYCCRAFVTTASGTIYGEVQTFVTTEDLTGVYGVQTNADKLTVIGYYDLQGRRLSSKAKGVNIIKYSDGTARKLYVK